MRWLFVGEALVLRKDQRILVSLVLNPLIHSAYGANPQGRQARNPRTAGANPLAVLRQQAALAGRL